MSVSRSRTDLSRCAHRRWTALKVDERYGFRCNGCQERGYGSGFKCADGCGFQLHKECQSGAISATPPFFEHAFTLQFEQTPNTNNLCEACGMRVKGWKYSYRCEGGNIFLHPSCMKLPRIIDINDDDTLVLKKKLKSVVCDRCDSLTLGGRIDGWAYVSTDHGLACRHVKCMKKKLYDDWTKYAHTQRDEKIGGPWWLTSYADFDDKATVPRKGASSSSKQSSPPQHFHKAVHQPDNKAARKQDRSVVQDSYNKTARKQDRSVVQGNYNNAGPSRQQDSTIHLHQHQHQYPIVVYQQVFNPNQQHSNLALTTIPTRRKRRSLWKFTKAAAKIFINVLSGNPVGSLSAVYDLLRPYKA